MSKKKSSTIFMQTTEVSVNSTALDIQKVLVKYGATATLIEYENHEIKAISFKYVTDGVERPYLIPSKWEAVKALLIQKNPAWKYKKDINDLSKRIAWRQTFRWIESQLAYTETKQVKFEQVFLSYMQDSLTGKTLYDYLEARSFKMLDWTEAETDAKNED